MDGLEGASGSEESIVNTDTRARVIPVVASGDDALASEITAGEAKVVNVE